MNDRELLEYAAKASGDKIIGWTLDQNGVEVAITENEHYWQPLTKNLLTDCMGDALRLAVKLGILHSEYDYFMKFYYEYIECDLKPSEATRRAIVHTAAKIGKTK